MDVSEFQLSIFMLTWSTLEWNAHSISLVINGLVLKSRDLHIWPEPSNSLANTIWVQEMGVHPAGSDHVVVEGPGTCGDCEGLLTAGTGVEKADAVGRWGFHKYFWSHAEILGFLILTSEEAALVQLPVCIFERWMGRGWGGHFESGITT